MSFLFVDRITALTSETATGWLDVGTDAAVPPSWLVIEAVGQLAAWVAMARTDFRRRPVAALVGEVRLQPAPARGRLALAARVDRFDGRAILYSGSARIGDVALAELAQCVGPMLPMELFDDPERVRARLDALRVAQTAPPAHEPRDLCGARLDWIAPAGRGMWRGTLRVPEHAALFADHFPLRPVYPATLLADAENQVAIPVAAAALGVPAERVWPRRVADFKVRAFSPPGQTLELTAELERGDASGALVAVSATAAGKRINTGYVEYGVSS
jgi:3-hydroxymyristoyl/3-hydroxydecanoyl-(acyl carrier protein) dehydratase